MVSNGIRKCDYIIKRNWMSANNFISVICEIFSFIYYFNNY